MTTPNRPGTSYQGYPYVKPTYYEAPSIPADVNTPSFSSRPGTFDNRPAQSDESQPELDEVTHNDDRRLSEEDNTLQAVELNEVVTPPYNRYGIAKPKNSPETPEPDTILYDPFENKRIEIPSTSNRPVRPITLDFNRPYTNEPQSPTSSVCSSDSEEIARVVTSQPTAGSSSLRSPSGVPDFMNKQATIYEQNNVIPMENFPEPPPAYTEVEIPRTPRPESGEQYPRTQVIISPPAPSSTLAMSANGLDRKTVECPTCKTRVTTVVHKSIGWSTHILGAGCCLFGCWPCTAWVYLGNTFKENYHFCPNCNTKIGREIPFLGMSIFKAKPEI